ncbi:MAG TPA: glycosyltransferase family 2 protein [Candidatus Nanoarchaeia archaeon]|nr:glycosyltransferase family 2 protein [Candidatus Nanoarchaeia archaeon]
MFKVGIIIVNYKDYAQRFLADCRDSLRAQNYPREDVKFYVVDNVSSAESAAYLRENFSEAKIIPRPDGNYAAANNAGIAAARADGAEVFVIANMDMVFEPDWLKELIAALDSGEKIGIAQSKILLYSADGKTKKINTLGNAINFLGFGFTTGYKENDREISGLPEIKGYASGGSCAIKQEVLDKIGGYNEEYYMYHDDLEIGWKTKIAGYKIVLAPKSVCYHKYEFSRSIKMVYYMERNRLLAVFSFYEFTSILAIIPALIFMELGQLFFALIKGWLTEKLKADDYFLRAPNWDKIMAARKKVKIFRVKKDRDIVDDFAGEILFQEIDNPVLKYFANPFFKRYWDLAKKVIKG